MAWLRTRLGAVGPLSSPSGAASHSSPELNTSWPPPRGLPSRRDRIPCPNAWPQRTEVGDRESPSGGSRDAVHECVFALRTSPSRRRPRSENDHPVLDAQPAGIRSLGRSRGGRPNRIDRAGPESLPSPQAGIRRSRSGPREISPNRQPRRLPHACRGPHVQTGRGGRP